MLTGCIKDEQQVRLGGMSSENAVKPRPSSNEHNTTEHLEQTLYRLYSIAKISNSF